ncbi:hypothetical protein A0H81_07700 [Grifola frondosa]|uniref:Uncharacterized protein n=1 Tax=Grifola frondosa TaxID=5627 RepID=A0A1C7M6Y0_GRIFR|nr:hypothetical protein A0H81_07700 [Grifola frondosa]
MIWVLSRNFLFSSTYPVSLLSNLFFVLFGSAYFSSRHCSKPNFEPNFQSIEAHGGSLNPVSRFSGLGLNSDGTAFNDIYFGLEALISSTGSTDVSPCRIPSSLVTFLLSLVSNWDRETVQFTGLRSRGVCMKADPTNSYRTYIVSTRLMPERANNYSRS